MVLNIHSSAASIPGSSSSSTRCGQVPNMDANDPYQIIHFMILLYPTVGGIKTVIFPFHLVPFKRKRVPVPFNKERELNGRWSRRQMVRPTSQTAASSNYMPEESKKAERSTTSVDLLVVDAIWIDQRSEIDRLKIAKIARSRAAITKHTKIRRAAAAVSQRSLSLPVEQW